MKISIIIPIYNVENYLNRCFDSIFGEGLPLSLYEVICVDDGSQDKSSEVVKQYQERYGNVILIEQDNHGVSVARNEALKYAKGEYVLFVDPDDVLCKNSISKVLEDCKSSRKADIIICNSLIKESQCYKWTHLFETDRIYKSAEVINAGFLRGSVCGVCFDRIFLTDNNIHFLPSVRNGEDTNFMLQAMYFSNKIRFSNIDLYYVVGRQDSASKLFTKQRIDCMIYSAKCICDYANELNSKIGNAMVLNYMQYIVVSNLVNDSLKTNGVGYSYLAKQGINSLCLLKIGKDVSFLKNKMKILYFSFHMFYLLCKVKY